jgi:hypothetical protein
MLTTAPVHSYAGMRNQYSDEAHRDNKNNGYWAVITGSASPP